MISVSNESIKKIERTEFALESMKKGEMIIVLDDKSRENEGDFIVPSESIRFDQLNTMVRMGGGLVCVALHPSICERLKLHPQVSFTDKYEVENSAQVHGGLPEAAQGTAFTVSVDAKEGILTGISIEDRLKTIKLLANPKSNASDLARPGHIFPIRARPGGLFERRGHTEAAVQLALLSGHQPSAVICEILNADGTMAREKELEGMAKELNLAFCSIDDLVTYLIQNKRKENYEH